MRKKFKMGLATLLLTMAVGALALLVLPAIITTFPMWSVPVLAVTAAAATGSGIYMAYSIHQENKKQHMADENKNILKQKIRQADLDSANKQSLGEITTQTNNDGLEIITERDNEDDLQDVPTSQPQPQSSAPATKQDIEEVKQKVLELQQQFSTFQESHENDSAARDALVFAQGSINNQENISRLRSSRQLGTFGLFAANEAEAETTLTADKFPNQRTRR